MEPEETDIEEELPEEEPHIQAGNDNPLKVLKTFTSIDIDYRPLSYATFRFPNDNRMLAVWKDGVAREEDPGVPATITFPGLQTDEVICLDILNSVKQDLTFVVSGEDTVIENMMIKDYPTIILKSPAQGSAYSETPGDGFVRFD